MEEQGEDNDNKDSSVKPSPSGGTTTKPLPNISAPIPSPTSSGAITTRPSTDDERADLPDLDKKKKKKTDPFMLIAVGFLGFALLYYFIFSSPAPSSSSMPKSLFEKKKKKRYYY